MPNIADLTGAPKGRRYPVGAEPSGNGYSFRVWAPGHRNVGIELEDGDAFALTDEGDGYFSADLPIEAGARYRIRLDENDELLADPASRFQPEGLDGPSQVVDPSGFQWNDADWPGPAGIDQVFYEMHPGTFTPEGTWAAALGKLAHLKRLGVTIVELLPLAQFQGSFGWGYDGVLNYAPYCEYGTPDDLRRFIDAAHEAALGVILDVVYNHLGPGGHFETFTKDYFSAGEPNEWGRPLNFSKTKGTGARAYFVASAIYWIDEFHFDGFRLDATQAIKDDSDEHVIAEIARKARLAAGSRKIIITAENERQDARLARPVDRGGYGLDAVWNEDLHHSAVVAATRRREAYQHDHHGTPQELVSAAKYGFLYQGQRYDWQDRPRGSNARDLGPQNFVQYLQNHDQIANLANGARLWQQISPARARAITTLFLLMPQMPLLFQGQEFAAETPFFYFFDVGGGKMGEEVENGRVDFLQQFPSLRDPAMRVRMAKPYERETFERSKLDWSDCERNSEVLLLHCDLLAMRQTDPALSRRGRERLVDGSVIGPEALLLRFSAENPTDDKLLVVNLGRDLPLQSIPDPLSAPPDGSEWVLDWSSEHPKYGGTGRREVDLAERVTFSSESAQLFRLQPERERPSFNQKALTDWQRDMF